MMRLAEEEYLQRFVFPEEERTQWTTAKWDGSYRWFTSRNVIPLERYRSAAEWSRICAALLGRP
jgi:hypothetical protein